MLPVSFFLYNLSIFLATLTTQINMNYLHGRLIINSKVYYFQSWHSVIVWNLSLAFFRFANLAFNCIMVILAKTQLAFELFLKNKDSYKVCN